MNKSFKINFIIHFSNIIFAIFNVSGIEKIKPEDIIDVAIIGAGVSGTYAGWRLTTVDPQKNKILKAILNNSKKLKVVIFEMSKRIGGRLWSYEIMPGLFAELGGMRFIDTQLMVKSLINYLKLKVIPFPSNISNGFQYLRGQRIFKQNYKSGFFKLPYNLKISEQGKSSAELLEETLNSFTPLTEKLKTGDFANLVEFWQDANVYGRPIYKWGMWNLLAKKLSFEAIAFIKDSAGYDDFYENSNAGSSISLMASTGGLGKTPPNYFTLATGYDSLPKTLAEKFVNQGGKILLNHQLVSVNCISHDAKTYLQILIRNLDNDISHTYYAKHLILAMPRQSIELLDKECFIFKDKPFRRNLAAIGRAIASKLFLLFDRPWWKKFGFDSGRSTTDLPIRQCFYIKPPEVKPNMSQYSLLMASYSDGESAEFWKSYLPIAAFEDEDAEIINYCDPDQILQCLTIPNSMKKEIQRQLKLMHGIEIPEPIKAIYHTWNQSPFGGGLHRWNPQVRPWEVIKFMRQPIKNMPLYIIGDSFSVMQNWVEGALISSEQLLRQSFGLENPSWLDPKYNLGP